MILVSAIQRATEEHFKLDTAALKSRVRTGDIVRPRQMAMYLSSRLTTKSLARIGTLFNRDHSTVISNIKVAERRCTEDAETRDAVREVARRVLREEAELAE